MVDRTPDGPAQSLQEQFGQIDVYLFDQALKGRIPAGTRVLDAGCGGGRNLHYLLREGYEVYGVDRDPDAVARTRALAAALAPRLAAEHFQVGSLEAGETPEGPFGLIICSAVLHFSDDAAAFGRAVHHLWGRLAPGGVLFTRLASSVGIEDRIRPLGRGWFQLPDGSERFLVDEPLLARATEKLGAEMLDPLKTTVVHGMRSMTTWVLRKPLPRPARTG